MEKNEISVEIVATKILMSRGKRVLLSNHLAELFVTLREHNESKKVTAIVRGHNIKYPPYAFTEQGVAMLSRVLNSNQAIQVNIAIMRAFVKLREILFTHEEVADKIIELERKTVGHDSKFIAIFEVIRQLMNPPTEPEKPKVGFHK